VEKLEREASEKLQAIAGVVAVEGAQAILRNAVDCVANGEPAAPMQVSITVCNVYKFKHILDYCMGSFAAISAVERALVQPQLLLNEH
jgi:hypothetical protein